jgi:hypothetical protein
MHETASNRKGVAERHSVSPRRKRRVVVCPVSE